MPSVPDPAVPAAPSPAAPKPVVAGPAVRLLAALYDGMLVLALLFFVGAVLIVAGTLLLGLEGQGSEASRVLPGWYQWLVQFPITLLTIWGFYGLFWRRSGQTLGMQTWRLKTVTATGQLLNWPQTFLRCAMASLLPLACGGLTWLLNGHAGMTALSLLLGFMANYLWAGFNHRRLALHDMLSGTLTLRMPPGDVRSFKDFIQRMKQS